MTLLLPLVGIVSGGWTGQLASGRPWTAGVVTDLAVAAVAASLLNAASNTLNQVYDLELDRVNKPERPLVRGEVGSMEALVASGVGYALALGLAATLSLPTAVLFAIGAASTLVYSVPALGRTKRLTWGSNLTIAVPRGGLLKVAGWSVCASVSDPEPWFLGAVFALFLFGATSSKDFSDIEGDRAAGCATLPVRLGPRRAARTIAPFFVLPWWLLPLGALVPGPGADGAPVLTASPLALGLLACVLAGVGARVAGSILRDPEALVGRENHPAWTGMYAMALVAHLGVVAAYAG
jgi:4-hydroxybenzoate polyprenyltransferase